MTSLTKELELIKPGADTEVDAIGWDHYVPNPELIPESMSNSMTSQALLGLQEGEVGMRKPLIRVHLRAKDPILA